MKRILWRWLRPWLRYYSEPEIQVRTYYPGCRIKITKPGRDWLVESSNDDPDKIPTELIKDIFEGLLQEHIAEDATLTRGFSFDFALDSVSLENWRDIHNGRISRLIEDDEDEFESEKIGAFGFLLGTTKPERLDYLELTNKSPDKFAFIETEKYVPNMKNLLSLLDFKRKFKIRHRLAGPHVQHQILLDVVSETTDVLCRTQSEICLGKAIETLGSLYSGKTRFQRSGEAL